MKSPNDGQRHRAGSVLLDLAKVELALRNMGLTWTSEKPICDVSRATWHRLRNGARISMASAKAIAVFLQLDLDELLVSDDPDEEAIFTWPEHPEWEIAEGNPGWNPTSNGLYFFRCKVKHKHLGDDVNPVYGRARVYDLTRVPDKRRAEMKEHLTRHPLVCRMLSQFPYFVGNLSVAPVAGGKLWWVVDEWVDGQTLDEAMRRGPIEWDQLRTWMKEIALALKVLHEQKIIVRELSPRRIIVESKSRAHLTELDLAKLMLGSKTVSADWPLDPYRAPEVEEGQPTEQADFFSWAMIYLHAVTGDSQLTSADFDRIDTANPSRELRGMLESCLSPMRSRRPRSADELVRVVS